MGNPDRSMSDSQNATDPEIGDLKQTLVCVRQITRDFNAMADRRRMAGAELALLSEELGRMGGNASLTPHPALAGAIQELEQSMARRKALGKELCQAASNFAQQLIRWAEALEKRKQQKPALSAAPSIPIVTGGSGLMPDDFGDSAPKGGGCPASENRGPDKTSASSGDASGGTMATSPLAQVLKALEEGGQNPTPAQLERIGNACDAWQSYAVSHGVSPFVAGQQIQNIVHNYYSNGSGPNAGSAGVLGFQQGQAAGAGAGGIIAGAIVGVSSAQKPGSVWSMGPWTRGEAVEIQLGGNLPSGFPTIDRFENGVATSIKSIDLNAPSYQNMGKLAYTLDTYTDKVANLNGADWGDESIAGSQIRARQLQIAIPPGSMSPAQQAVITAQVTQAQIKGVTLIVTEVH